MLSTIISIHVGKPQKARSTFPSDPNETMWRTAFGKHRVAGRVRLRQQNFEGDAQADLKHHGGPDKAVCVYPDTHYPFWREELSMQLDKGAFGENLTVAGLTESTVCLGDIWQIGDARVQISQPRQPCWKLSRWWNIEDLAVRVQQTGRTGWYLRVLEEGEVEAETPITLVERLHPEWTIEAANELMHRDKNNLSDAEVLSKLPELSTSWRTTFMQRCRKQATPSATRRLLGDKL